RTSHTFPYTTLFRSNAQLGRTRTRVAGTFGIGRLHGAFPVKPEGRSGALHDGARQMPAAGGYPPRTLRHKLLDDTVFERMESHKDRKSTRLNSSHVK